MLAVNHLATLLALASTSFAGFHLKTDVSRFATNDCTGGAFADKHRKIKSDHCESYGSSTFNSFMYEPHHKSDGGYRDTKECNITAYTGPDCTGKGFSPGSMHRSAVLV